MAMFQFVMELSGVREARLRNLAQRVLHRLGDSAQKIWTYEEIVSYIERGAKELTADAHIVWDQAYLENLPAGFNFTADFEAAYAIDGFFYGQAQSTYPDEAAIADEEALIESDDHIVANHTSPADLNLFAGSSANEASPAVSQLPASMTDLERATWDHRTIEASTTARAQRFDSRYQITEGEVYAYVTQDDGPNSFRKVRVPAAMADIYEYDGAWGVVRNLDTVAPDEDITGSWGIPRRIPGWHPMGNTEGFGMPRRFYRDGKNVKIEFFRHPRIDSSMLDSELPERYFLYLADFAQREALRRNGAGQNYKMAQLYDDRWKRGIERVKRRLQVQNKKRTHRLGGDVLRYASGPPRPKLPWQYGDDVR